jgi:Ras homolog gene family, member A
MFEGDRIRDIEIDNRLIDLWLWDTVAQAESDRERRLSYQGTHVFLICFSVDRRESLDSVAEKWIPETSHFCPGVPFLLVGCRTDLRHERRITDALTKIGEKVISNEEGIEMAKKFGAEGYVECSAIAGEGVERVFRTAATVALAHTPKAKHKTCVIV